MNFEIPGIYFFLIDIFIPVVAVCGCLSAILFMKVMHERAHKSFHLNRLTYSLNRLTEQLKAPCLQS